MDIHWQMYWTKWYQLPWLHKTEADEYGPAETWFGIGPLQVRIIHWLKS